MFLKQINFKKYFIKTTKQFSQNKKGFFGLNILKDSETLRNHTINTIEQCKTYISEIHNQKTNLNILNKIDQISNECCIIIDSCTAIYQIANNKEIIETAGESITLINQFFEDLNQNKKFYNKILDLYFSDIVTAGVLIDNEMSSLLNRNIEELSLMNRMHSNNNENFAENIETMINELKNCSDRLYPITITDIEINDLKSNVLKTLIKVAIKNNTQNKDLETNDKSHNLNVEFNLLQTILRKSNNQSLRDKAFQSLSIYGKENLNRMVDILKMRLKFAKSMGYKTFSEYTLKTQTLKLNPENLTKLIEQLWIDIRPNLILELTTLNNYFKISEEYLTSYDIDFYRSNFIDSNIKQIDESILNKRYITIGNIFQGLKTITKLLFNKDLKYVLDESELTEAMIHESVLLSNLMYKGKSIGKVYFDMFVRDGKYRDIFSQFTIQGSKVINLHNHNFRQNPITVLSTNLEVTELDLMNMPITFIDAKNIFHEFGHILHSLLSNTEYQAISGNRIPLDFAEVPSHLFEYFLYDISFCKTFMIDNKTNTPIDERLHRMFSIEAKNFGNLDLQETLYNSLLDLKIHSFSDSEDITAENIIKINQEIVSKFYINNHVNFSKEFFEDFNKIIEKSSKNINWKFAIDKFYNNLIQIDKNNNNKQNYNKEDEFVGEINQLFLKNKIDNKRNKKIIDYSFTNLPHFKNYPSNYYTYIFGKVFANLIWTDCFMANSGKIDQVGQSLEKDFLSKGYTDSPINLINNFIKNCEKL